MGGLSLCFAGLGWRLVDLQINRHAELAGESRKNIIRREALMPQRGDIFDSRGSSLVTSRVVWNVRADPGVMTNNYKIVAAAIAPLLELDRETVEKKLTPRYSTNAAGQVRVDRYAPLKRHVSDEKWTEIQKVMKSLDFGVDEKKLKKRQVWALRETRKSGVAAEQDFVRVHPNGSLAAHVLGYVGDAVASADMPISTTGIDGIERILNDQLTGAPGWRQFETDSARNEMENRQEQLILPSDGLNVFLTIDSGVQHIVETELAEAAAKHSPVGVSCVVVKPATGQILALANFPTFNPDDVKSSAPEMLRNRAVTDFHEPGSTFKTIVISGGLNEGVVRLDEMFNCENGRWIFAGKALHDAGNHHYGVIPVRRILSHSSNIGAAKVALKMGPEMVYEYVRRFGFGIQTGIPLGAEASGIARSPEKWSKLSITRIAMGHEVTATPLQMTMAVAAIANRGALMRPMLVDRLADRKGVVVQRFTPQVVTNAISPAAAAMMVSALKDVVSTNGTAPMTKLPFHTVAGKTGTAQKSDGRGYAKGKYFSSFIGFFPADNPEVCIGVFIDEPKNGYYGGETAGVTFQQIGEKVANYLAIPPDGSRETIAMRETGPRP